MIVGNWGTQNAELEIDNFLLFESESGEEHVLFSRSNGVVEKWNIENGSKINSITLPAPSSKVELKNTGLGYFQKNSDRKGDIVVCNNHGDVHVLPFDDPDSDSKQISFKIPKDVERVRLNQEETMIASGGKEHIAQTWDLETQKCTWSGRNVKLNDMRMRVRVWVKDLQYMPNQPHQIATVTAYSHVRLYDPKVQRRPVMNVELGDETFTCVTPTKDGNYLLIGDVKGNMHKFDLRKRQSAGSFKGKMVGAIREISVHPTLSKVSCCSLDRYIRVFDINTRALTHKIYAKQRLNCCGFSKELEINQEEEEDQETWESLPKTNEGFSDDDQSDGDSSDEIEALEEADWPEQETKPLKKRTTTKNQGGKPKRHKVK